MTDALVPLQDPPREPGRSIVIWGASRTILAMVRNNAQAQCRSSKVHWLRIFFSDLTGDGPDNDIVHDLIMGIIGAHRDALSLTRLRLRLLLTLLQRLGRQCFLGLLFSAQRRIAAQIAARLDLAAGAFTRNNRRYREAHSACKRGVRFSFSGYSSTYDPTGGKKKRRRIVRSTPKSDRRMSRACVAASVSGLSI
jgi:hypothetical protein